MAQHSKTALVTGASRGIGRVTAAARWGFLGAVVAKAFSFRFPDGFGSGSMGFYRG
jgi:hypothetical protein